MAGFAWDFAWLVPQFLCDTAFRVLDETNEATKKTKRQGESTLLFSSLHDLILPMLACHLEE